MLFIYWSILFFVVYFILRDLFGDKIGVNITGLCSLLVMVVFILVTRG